MLALRPFADIDADHDRPAAERRGAQRQPGWFSRLNGRIEQGFERMRSSYAELLAILLTRG